ncbi:MAG: response regulator [bacterium]|nr:response regulator [bacterium]
MKKELKILMIDDHPMIIEGYKKVLLSNKTLNFDIKIANNCDQAISTIHKVKDSNFFDIVFIDIQLPPSTDGSITSGEELAIFVNAEQSNAKIVILTMIDNPHRLQNILNTIPHHGILIKSDITSKLLLKALDNILNNILFYSGTVQKLKNKDLLNDDSVDEYNRKIIYHLSKGVKTKNLIKHIPLSLSAIEKRKNFIKDLFNVDGGDEQLLIEAKKRGFI